VATAGYTGNATRKLQRKVIPIGSFIIATERLPVKLAHELSPKNRMIFDYKHYLNYFRLWDNRMIFGGARIFRNGEHDTTKREILQREMIQVYPQLKMVGIPGRHSICLRHDDTCREDDELLFIVMVMAWQWERIWQDRGGSDGKRNINQHRTINFCAWDCITDFRFCHSQAGIRFWT
jgi:hypothetical protein